MVRSDTADSRALGLSIASPMPILTTTFSIRGTCIIFLKSNALRRAGTISVLYLSCILFIASHSALIDQRLAVFTNAARTVFIALDSNASRLTTFGADQHHI